MVVSKFIQQAVIRPLLVCSILLYALGATAQTKVVVVPLGGDSAPSFRIVANTDDAGASPQSNFGRLEYTADSNPSPDSDWGTVCDDFLTGNTDILRVKQFNTLANLACRNMGYLGGTGIQSNDVGGPTVPGNLPTLLDDVICPEGATSIRQCSTAEFENCTNIEDIGVRCHLASESFLLNGVFSSQGSCQFEGSASATVSHNLNYIDDPTLQNIDPGLDHGTPFGDEIEIEFRLNSTGINTFTYIAQAPGNSDPGQRFASVNYACTDSTVDASFTYTDNQGHRWLVTPSLFPGGFNGFTVITVVQFERIP